MSGLSLEARIEEVARRDRRYAVEAFHFVFEALDAASERTSVRASRHVTVAQLLEGVRRVALEQFGPLARCVFESWGVYGTEDFGEIVFRLIDNDLLNRGEHDLKEDFHNAFSFREAFEEGYQPRIHIDRASS
jgi:uncharacterized repeat protein (TIGR04138 family)